MKITLCGSTRFHDRYKDINARLSKAGHVVYSVALSEKAGDPLTEDEKETLDLVHLRKIQESDAIFIIGWEPEKKKTYIGASTRRELKWAQMLGKGIYTENNTWISEAGVNGILDELVPE